MSFQVGAGRGRAGQGLCWVGWGGAAGAASLPGDTPRRAACPAIALLLPSPAQLSASPLCHHHPPQVPMHSASGVRVQYLKVWEKVGGRAGGGGCCTWGGPACWESVLLPSTGSLCCTQPTCRSPTSATLACPTHPPHHRSPRTRWTSGCASCARAATTRYASSRLQAPLAAEAVGQARTASTAGAPCRCPRVRRPQRPGYGRRSRVSLFCYSLFI